MRCNITRSQLWRELWSAHHLIEVKNIPLESLRFKVKDNREG